MFDNDCAELSHAFTEPGGYTASVKREIGSTGTLHASILIANGHSEKQNSTMADGANGWRRDSLRLANRPSGTTQSRRENLATCRLHVTDFLLNEHIGNLLAQYE